ncbi:MAG: hypothetical protein AMXMBFR64_26540 [Myxococcales bacterium]
MARLADVMADLVRHFPSGRLQVHPPGAEWDRMDSGAWSIVASPHGEEEVCRTLQVAERFIVPVAVGGTQGFGGTRVRPGGVIRIDTTTMGSVVSIDVASSLVTVQTGISVAVLESRLAERRLTLGWSPAWSDPHTLGGVLAGAVEDRWGPAHGGVAAAVRALTVVLPDGSRAWSRLSPRRATGPDLTSLALGTFGRIGVVTGATLRVFPRPAARLVLTADTRDPGAVVRGVGALLRTCCRPHLIELTGRPDGSATLLLSLWGTDTAVAEQAARASCIPVALSELPMLPSPPVIDDAKHRARLTLPQVARLLDAWAAAPTRRALRVDRFDSHTAQVATADRVPPEVAAPDGPLGSTPRGVNQKYLQRLKLALDPHNLLGSL